MPKRAIIFINSAKKEARLFGQKIKTELFSRKISVDIYASKGKPDFHTERGYDIAISLGGDGTVLAAARAMSPLGVPIFPVNFGTFGFIAGVNANECPDILIKGLEGKLPVSKRLMLDVRVERAGKEVLKGCCLNDIVISASGIAKLIKLKVSYFDSKSKKAVNLGLYRSDGLIVATPTGSTAYSGASGGPVLDPELEAMILNPICPFTFSSRPLVLPVDDIVQVDIEKDQRSGVLLTVDGQVTEKLKSGDKVFLKKAPYHCLLMASVREGFYETLRSKFLMIPENEVEV
ncbi:MAG: NAD(+)/NADH kinase [Treponema sp.]|nr:NAD(+)/NADH kinase [Treponema sp.]